MHVAIKDFPKEPVIAGGIRPQSCKTSLLVASSGIICSYFYWYFTRAKIIICPCFSQILTKYVVQNYTIVDISLLILQIVLNCVFITLISIY